MATNPFARDPAVTVGVGADTSGFGEAIDGAIGKLGSFKGAVAGLGVALGAVAVGGLAKATQAAASFEEQMVEVEKVTDPATAREMGDAIQDMAAEMPVAQEELAGITAQAGRFGIEGSENIEQFTETVAKMSVATDLSTEQAGESFARLSTLMDEPIENVGNMGNVINELSNTMATSSSEITDSALRSSGVLSQMGASSEDILSLNAAMNEASESAERAGTRLRRMAQEIQDPKKVEDLASALGMNVEEFKRMRSEDPTALFREMAQTMGEGDEQADALRQTLSTTSQQALTGLSQNMEGLAQAQETANQQMENGTSLQNEYESASSTFNSQLQVTKNRIRNIGIDIGEVLLPHLSALLGHVNRGISAFSSFNEKTSGVAGALGLIGTAIGGTVSGLALLASQLGLATSATAALGGGVGALGTAFTVLTGPIGIAIAAIAALAAAWTMNLGGIQDKTRAVFSAVKEYVAGNIRAIKNNIIQPILDQINAIWQRHGDQLTSEAQATWQVVKGRVQWGINAIKAIIMPFINAVSAAWSRWGDEIITVARAAFDGVVNLVKVVMDGVLTTIRVTLALIRGDWKQAWNLVKGFLKRTLDTILSQIKSWGGGLKSAIGSAVDSAKTKIKDGFQSAVDSAKEVLNGLLTWVTNWDIAGAIKGAFSGAGEAAASAFKSAFNSAIPSSISVPDELDALPGVNTGGSISLPQLDTGGYIEEGGLAQLHAGERVVPAAEVDRDGGGGGGTTIQVDKIVASGYREGQEALRGLNDEFDSHGV